MPNPLDADPECAQLAKLIIRQSQEDDLFGFTKRQVRSIKRTEKGQRIWKSLSQTCFIEIPGKGRKFDFSAFCRELCQPEFTATRRCFRVAKESFASHDPREVCFVQVWDLCKRVEHVWTDLHSLAN